MLKFDIESWPSDIPVLLTNYARAQEKDNCLLFVLGSSLCVMGTFKDFFIRLCSTSDNLTHDLLNPRSNMSASLDY